MDFHTNLRNCSDTQLNRIMRMQQIKALKASLDSFDAYTELKKEFLTLHIEKLGIPLKSLNKSERNTILNLKYSSYPLPNDWLNSFMEDKTEPTQSIKKIILDYYQDAFGFLFKNFNLENVIQIHRCIENEKKTPDEKIKFVLNMLNQDWGAKGFSIQDAFSPVTKIIMDSFNPWLQNLKSYMDQMSNSHICYRLLGISSDNVILGTSFEHPTVPIVNLFDIYNYHRHRKTNHAAMSVCNALFKPLQPFFYEYVELAQSEKNIIMICIRAFMPFIIMSMVLTLGYAAILPLAYHQLIEYIFFIPSLYFSIVIASQYIQLRNYMYLNFIQWFYGSVYATSHYEPNQHIINGMKSHALANNVAEYYVLCLEECDKIERSYQALPGPLMEYQIANRAENLKRRNELLEEWQNLRSSETKPVQMISIVESRLSGDKTSTNDIIIEMYSIYFSLPDKERDAFKKEYLFLKEKLDKIDEIQPQLSNTKKMDNNTSNKAPFHFQKPMR
jgi:hypothetical protein